MDLRPLDQVFVRIELREYGFFRNAMTSYFDLARDEGQSSLGAFRPSCFINQLPVGGIIVAPNTVYLVRLHFAELDTISPGQRVFDVAIAEKTVLTEFDVLQAAGKSHTAVVEQFTALATGGKLRLQVIPKKGVPIIAGIEILAKG